MCIKFYLSDAHVWLNGFQTNFIAVTVLTYLEYYVAKSIVENKQVSQLYTHIIKQFPMRLESWLYEMNSISPASCLGYRTQKTIPEFNCLLLT